MEDSTKELYKKIVKMIVVAGCVLILAAMNDENLKLLGL